MPLIRLKSDSHIRIGKIRVTAAQPPALLSRFTRLVFCMTKTEEYPYAFRGSATSLRWQGHHLAFFCNDQVHGFEPRDVVVPLDPDGKVFCFRIRLYSDDADRRIRWRRIWQSLWLECENPQQFGPMTKLEVAPCSAT